VFLALPGYQETTFHQPIQLLLDEGQSFFHILDSGSFLFEISDQEGQFVEDLVGRERLEKKSVGQDFGEAEVDVFRGAEGLLFLIVIDEAEDKTKST
jgi:hypothetical protein